jgi:hypothetical protein
MMNSLFSQAQKGRAREGKKKERERGMGKGEKIVCGAESLLDSLVEADAKPPPPPALLLLLLLLSISRRSKT